MSRLAMLLLLSSCATNAGSSASAYYSQDAHSDTSADTATHPECVVWLFTPPNGCIYEFICPDEQVGMADNVTACLNPPIPNSTWEPCREHADPSDKCKKHF